MATSVLSRMQDLLERQKTSATLTFPGEDRPVRQGSFKVSSKLLKYWKDEVGKQGPHMLLFKNIRDHIDKIPRNDLAKIWGKDNIPDAQDLISTHPKQAFQMWLRNVKRVSPKLQTYIQATSENVPLVYYAFMAKVVGNDMADIIFKRHFHTDSDHIGAAMAKMKKAKAAKAQTVKKATLSRNASMADYTDPTQEAVGGSKRELFVTTGKLLGTIRCYPGFEITEKKKTFPEARKEILDYLSTQPGWKVSGPLKVPHATKGDFRLWFKSQAVYYEVGKPFKLGNARTISYDFDIRTMDGPKFLATIERRFKDDMR